MSESHVLLRSYCDSSSAADRLESIAYAESVEEAKRIMLSKKHTQRDILFICDISYVADYENSNEGVWFANASGEATQAPHLQKELYYLDCANWFEFWTSGESTPDDMMHAAGMLCGQKTFSKIARYIARYAIQYSSDHNERLNKIIDMCEENYDETKIELAARELQAISGYSHRNRLPFVEVVCNAAYASISEIPYQKRPFAYAFKTIESANLAIMSTGRKFLHRDLSLVINSAVALRELFYESQFHLSVSSNQHIL